ncbi:MAG TPA: DUF1127 domain-containing protein [Dongiaceae bacterium]|jgi:uncharacterized protein YjiS (DUF1127 family)
MRSQTWNQIVHRRARNTLVFAVWTAAKFVWSILQGWSERARQRRTLALLSDHSLRDIGLSRMEVNFESRRPFWRE